MYRLLRWLLGALFRLVYRPRVEGLEHVPRRGAVIIASNHLSFADSVVIPLVLPRRVRFLAKAEYFTGRGVRGRAMALFFHVIDAVPVRRGGQRESLDALDAALEVLRAGQAFGIYPEGTRSRDGRLYRGRTGVAWLALASGAPVVPVALCGTREIQPIGARWPRIRPLRISFGPPVDPTLFAERIEAGASVGKARREITDLVMDRIAAMSGQDRVTGYNDHTSSAA